MMRIAFLDDRPSYDGLALQNQPMSGVQSGTVLLAEALARRGRNVTIFNQRDKSLDLNNVVYKDLPQGCLNDAFDIAISNTNIKVLDKAVCASHIVWARNNIVLKKIIKSGVLQSLIRNRPHIVFPSYYASSRTSRLWPFRSRSIIHHGFNAEFFSSVKEVPSDPIAIFASDPSRNLQVVLDIWRAVIHPAVPNSRLHIYHPRGFSDFGDINVLSRQGIELKGSVGKRQLASAMQKARIMLYPGHRCETFCNSAAEALCAGAPLVTMGIGALKERVRHDVDGLISSTPTQMGHDAIRLLTDDNLWWRMHKAAIEGSRNSDWERRAAQWEQLFARVKG